MDASVTPEVIGDIPEKWGNGFGTECEEDLAYVLGDIASLSTPTVAIYDKHTNW